MYRECRYLQEGGHPGPSDILDDFADKVIGVLSPGIQARMQRGGGGGSPGKKAKNKPINHTWQQVRHTGTTVGKGDREKLRDKLWKNSCVRNKLRENISGRQQYWDCVCVHGQQRSNDGIFALSMRWKQRHREKGWSPCQLRYRTKYSS